MTLTGPDVSHHQGVVDMRLVHDEGHHVFVGIKATESRSYLDPLFRTNRAHARTAGLVRLIYHFGRPGADASEADAQAEAGWFIRMIGDLEPGEIAVLDLEDDKVPAGKDLTAWMLAFLAAVDGATGRSGEDDAELYTYGPYARAHIRLRTTDRHLWLAAYSSTPSVPPPWQSLTFHQYTSSGSCPGITGRCDLNRFHGSLDELHALAGMGDDDMTPEQDQMLRKIADWIDKVETGVPNVGVEPLVTSTSQAHRNTKKIAAKLGITDAE